MFTTTLISLLLAALVGVNTSGGVPDPARRGASAPSDGEVVSAGINPVQHSE